MKYKLAAVVFLVVFVHECKGLINKPTWTKNDFKILIEPATEECFYQTVTNGSVFHVSFQLVQGDDIHFYIENPDGQEIYRVAYDTKGTHQISNAPADGDYKICLDNGYSGVYHKLAYIYFLIFHANDIKERFQAEKDFNATSEVILKSTSMIYMRMLDAHTQQALRRFHQARDDYTSEVNNEMVMYWSLFQTVVIVVCGVFQVHFIKRLFLTSKPMRNSS